QIAAMCERDPKRAQMLLEDTSRCPPEYCDFAWAYLRRLCHRDDLVYREHAKNDGLEAIAVAPGGTFVATAGAKGEIRVWDRRTGRTYATLYSHVGPIHSLAFSPDGGALASAGADHTVRLWVFPTEMLDLARRTVNTLVFLQPIVKPFILHAPLTLVYGKEANCVAFSPEGRRVAAGYA